MIVFKPKANERKITKFLRENLYLSYFVRVYEESFLLIIIACQFDILLFDQAHREIPGFALSILFALGYVLIMFYLFFLSLRQKKNKQDLEKF